MASIALAPALLWIAFLATQWVAQGFGEMPRSNVAIPAPIQANAQRNAHTSKAPKGIRGFWVFVAGALLFLVYVGIFIPAFAGHKAIPQTAGGSITGTAMFFYLLWRWRGKQGWHGALLGALVGVIVIFMAAALSSYEIAHSAPWNSFTPTQ